MDLSIDVSTGTLLLDDGTGWDPSRRPPVVNSAAALPEAHVKAVEDGRAARSEPCR